MIPEIFYRKLTSVLQYSDSGWLTCAGYPGSFQNEAKDAKTYQDWGFDYLK